MKNAERRRNLELEGFSNDIIALRKKVLFYQNYIRKLKNLVEEDQ